MFLHVLELMIVEKDNVNQYLFPVNLFYKIPTCKLKFTNNVNQDLHGVNSIDMYMEIFNFSSVCR